MKINGASPRAAVDAARTAAKKYAGKKFCTADINNDSSIDCSDYGRLIGNGICSDLAPTTALVAAATGTPVVYAVALSGVSTVDVRTEISSTMAWMAMREAAKMAVNETLSALARMLCKKAALLWSY